MYWTVAGEAQKRTIVRKMKTEKFEWTRKELGYCKDRKYTKY
jgi:hypothetical protein